MKVLAVNMSLDPVRGGGTAERTVKTSQALGALGEQCTILTVDAGRTSLGHMSRDRIRVIALPRLNRRFYLPRVSYGRIRRLVSSVDIVHLMGHWTVINALVHIAARRVGVPYVVCPAGSLALYGRSLALKRLYSACVGESMVRHAAAHIAVAPNEVAHFLTYGITPDRVRLIPNGVDEADFSADDRAAFRKKYGLGNSPFVLFVGRLSQIKGPDLLLQAFAQVRSTFPDYHLVFVGPDEGMLPRLRELAADLEVRDAVHFLGYLGGDDKSRAYHAAALTVIPSRREAMSIVVLEAGICGCAVLMTDQCGFDDVRTTSGGLVVPADAASLQQGLRRLLSAPKELLAMGLNLKRHVSERFSWIGVGRQYLDLFHEVVKAQRKPK